MNNKNYFINPFARVQEKTLLTIGLICFVIGLFIAYEMKMQLQILRISPEENIRLDQVLFHHASIVVLLTAFFFGLGKIINPKTRFIDILNTVLIALIPIYLSFFQNWNHFLSRNLNRTLEHLKSDQLQSYVPSIGFFMVIIIGLLFFIYYIYLLFIGFKTATHAKKGWHFVLFFVVLLLVDVISSYFFNSVAP